MSRVSSAGVPHMAAAPASWAKPQPFFAVFLAAGFFADFAVLVGFFAIVGTPWLKGHAIGTHGIFGDTIAGRMRSRLEHCCCSVRDAAECTIRDVVSLDRGQPLARQRRRPCFLKLFMWAGCYPGGEASLLRNLTFDAVSPRASREGPRQESCAGFRATT